jgi:transposase
VEHAAERVGRLERAIDAAGLEAPPAICAVVDALQALRGKAKVSAVTIVAEVGRLSRFPQARSLMSYAGLGVSETSSGARHRRGRITKTGNAHLRRIVVEAAWAYRHRPTRGRALRARQAALSPTVTALAWKAQHRLCARYRHLLGKGKCQQQVITAVGREL